MDKDANDAEALAWLSLDSHPPRSRDGIRLTEETLEDFIKRIDADPSGWQKIVFEKGPLATAQVFKSVDQFAVIFGGVDEAKNSVSATIALPYMPVADPVAMKAFLVAHGISVASAPDASEDLAEVEPKPEGELGPPVHHTVRGPIRRGTP